MLLTAMPVQAAVGDADYIAKTNRAILDSDYSTQDTLAYSMANAISGKNITMAYGDDEDYYAYGYDALGNKTTYILARTAPPIFNTMQTAM